MTKVVDLYLKNIHPYGFRSGNWAKIVGVKLVTPDSNESRICYEILYPDGVKDYTAMSDRLNYQISDKPVEEIDVTHNHRKTVQRDKKAS